MHGIKKNLTNYKKYLSTSAVYCNDRSIINGTYSTSSSFDYAARTRLQTNKMPTYNCANIKDAFSAENTSAKLDYPVSLMTADEIAFAGGVSLQTMNTPYAWFISNSAGTQVSSEWWSLSPNNWLFKNAKVWNWDSGAANLNQFRVSVLYAVRPVISLNSCIKYGTGDGSATNPYTILETESGC